MTPAAVNLASRPFANTRPLRRVAVLLWIVGAALAAVAGALYWRSFFGIEGGREKIAAVDRSLAAEQRRLAAAEQALAGMDLRQQNVEASYLEARLRERTFPWSALFEHLAQVLPRHVRLSSLAPQSGDPRGTRRETACHLKRSPPPCSAQQSTLSGMRCSRVAAIGSPSSPAWVSAASRSASRCSCGEAFPSRPAGPFSQDRPSSTFSIGWH